MLLSFLAEKQILSKLQMIEKGTEVMRRVIVVLLMASSGWVVFAEATQVATITRLDGKVQVFANPSKVIQDKKDMVKFEDAYYQLRDAKIGDKLEKGMILRTLPDGKALVIYDNGDQINLGSGSSYKIDWNGSGEKAKSPELELKYGSIRAVISKQGPRNGLRLKTRSATMGVRGTDFSVSDNVADGATKLSVIRGEVLIKRVGEVKETPVKNGKTAEVRAEVQVRPTTKEETVVIHQNSVVPKQALKEEIFATPQTVSQVEVLEKKAVETTLKDIKEHDPKLYASISEQKLTSVQAVESQVMKQAFIAAPKGPTKPGAHDLDQLGDDAYERYFKVQ